MGEVAIDQIVKNRPFHKVEDFLFNDNIVYSKLNKKSLDVLCRCGALKSLVDKRFTGEKHFWSAIAIDRPRKLKNLEENIELYAPEGEFSNEEKISHIIELTGVFPFKRVMNTEIYDRLSELYIPAIANYDPELCQAVWFIPRKIVEKQTKHGKSYWIMEVIDDTNAMTKIRCWGLKKSDSILVNRPYLAKLEFNEKWGFSTRSIRRNFRLLG